MNASDWNTNDSWYVKYIGSVLIYSSTSYASTIVTEKFNFNFDETSWDSPIDYYSQTKYKVTSIYNETDYGGRNNYEWIKISIIGKISIEINYQLYSFLTKIMILRNPKLLLNFIYLQ